MTTRLCIGDDGKCGRPAVSRDMCNMHYLRWYDSTPPAERPPRLRNNLTPRDRFDAFVNKMGPVAKNRPELGRCHLWGGGTDAKGYGIFWVEGRSRRAHIWNYEDKVGPVPPDRELDHFACDRYGCVNEQHVRPTTHRENALRSNNGAAINAAKVKCPEGHDYDDSNTRVNSDGSRECLECKRGQQRRMKQAQRALKRGYEPLPEGHATCPTGHDLAGHGSYTYHGQIVCMTCTAPAPNRKGGRRPAQFSGGQRVA